MEEDFVCDYQCDNAFKIASQLKLNPMEVAQKICDTINICGVISPNDAPLASIVDIINPNSGSK